MVIIVRFELSDIERRALNAPHDGMADRNLCRGAILATVNATLEDAVSDYQTMKELEAEKRCHQNYITNEVRLWIANDYELYTLALGSRDYRELRQKARAEGLFEKQLEGLWDVFTSENLNIAQLDEAIKELAQD